MKTAISVPDEIFKQVDRVAKENNLSRSEVFVTAISEYLEKLKSKRMLDELDAVYSRAETDDEARLRAKTKKHYVQRVSKKETY